MQIGGRVSFRPARITTTGYPDACGRPRYLLTGMGRCAVCEGGWLAHTRDHGA